MKILILGGTGMLGHKAWQVMQGSGDVFLTIKGDFRVVEKFGIFNKKRTICHIDALDFKTVEGVIKKISPDVIFNCIGIVKQKKEAQDFVKSISINALFPHKLSRVCENIGARLINISTDCVFSGKKGNYTEKDYPDPLDLYSRTKLLGEVIAGNALTLRTSIIGHELMTRHGLLEWFLSQQGKAVKGYSKFIYSGFPAMVFCNILKDITLNRKGLKGLYHIASQPIDKYSLLCLIKVIYDLDIKIEKYENFICDRSLNCNAFKKAVNFKPASWQNMIKIMREDSNVYAERML